MQTEIFYPTLIQQHKKRLDNNLAAQIVSLLSSFCNEQWTTKIKKLYHAKLLLASEIQVEQYLHKPKQSLRQRLEPISYYPGASPLLVEAGMLLLELISLNDHKKDLQCDQKSKKYNPLNTELCYITEFNRIEKEWNFLPKNIKKEFSSLYKRSKTTFAWWG